MRFGAIVRRMSVLAALVDFALFQLAWFACVTQAAQGRPGLGIPAVAAFVLLQLARSRHRSVDLLLVALSLALGLVWDTGLLHAGLVHYASPGPLPSLAPAWLLALWALFAAVLRGPLRWLYGRPAMAALLGAIGGPASYAAAGRLGAATFAAGPLPMVVLAIGWAVLTPLLVEVARRLELGRIAASEAEAPHVS